MPGPHKYLSNQIRLEGYLMQAGGLKLVRMYSRALEETLYPNPLKPSKGSDESEDDSKKPDSRLASVSLHELIRSPANEFSERIKEYDNK